MGLSHEAHRDIVGLGRADQADAPFDLAIIKHDAARRDLDGGSAGALVDEQLCARIAEFGESCVERHRPVAPALVDREQAGFRAGARIRVDRLAIDDDEALGAQRLQPGVIGSRGDRTLDPGGQELLEGGEEDALKFDRESEHAIEKRRNRRQLVLNARRIHQL